MGTGFSLRKGIAFPIGFILQVFKNYISLPEKPALNDVLGSLVNNILDMVSPPEVVHDAPQFTTSPIRLCLIGKRFAGKQTFAQKLALAYNLAIISVDDIINEAVRYCNFKIVLFEGVS
jgi:hypothetical protein